MSKFISHALAPFGVIPETEDRIEDLDAWDVIETFFREYGFISHQLSSFNRFIDTAISKIIAQNKRIVVSRKGVEYTVEFEEIKILPPSHKELNDKIREICPKECIDRSITYAAQMLVDVIFTTPIKTTIHSNLYIGSVPIMVMSDKCNLTKIRFDKLEMARREEDIYERGGYFIVKGSPKVVITQERSAFNRVYVFKNHKYKPKFELYAEVRSFSLTGSRQTTAKVGIFTKTLLISVCVPYIDSISIPLGVIFRALGSGDEEEMLSYILSSRESNDEFRDYLVPSFEQSWNCDSQDAALHYIGRRGKKFTSGSSSQPVTSRKIKKAFLRKFLKKLESTDIPDQEAEIIDWLESGEGLEVKPEHVIEFLRIASLSETEENRLNQLCDFVEKLVKEKVRSEAISYAKHLLSIEFLPHVGIGEETFVQKRFFLGYMVKKLLLAYSGYEDPADRDHYKNKRNATVGILFSSLFSTVFKKFTNDIGNYIERCIDLDKPINLLSSFKSKTITDGLSNALSSDAWGGRGRKAPGTSQQYDRLNYLAGLSHLRRLVTPISAEGGKVEPPRKLHSSHWHAVCSGETPEGKKAGLVKNMAATCLITVGDDPSPIIRILETLNVVPFSEVISSPKLLDLDKIFVNGDMRGITSSPEDVVQTLRYIRRTGGFNPEISISYEREAHEIHISTEPGRLCRPMLIVSEGEILLSKKHIGEIREGKWDSVAGNCWYKLLREGYLELIDKSEEEELTITTSPNAFYRLSEEERLQITHCELNPSLMYGVGAAMVPFPDHDQAPRITYQASMGRQGVGRQPPNHIVMTKGTFHHLAFPQKPLVITRMARIIGFEHHPSSQNAVIAVCPWYGYGQEDSIIVNKDAVDRGFGKTYTYIAYEAIVRRDKNELFEIPEDNECSNFKGNPGKLDPITGIIPEGTIVEQGDILIGRTVKVDNTLSIHSHSKENISEMYNERIPGKVHLVRLGISRKKADDDINDEIPWQYLPDGNGYDYVKIVIVQERSPIEADKYSACHGQKGTIGKLMRSIDMPFTEEGIVPDIIVNPLAFPSRMTIGMLIETMKGFLRCISHRSNNCSVEKPLILDKDASPPGKERRRKKPTKTKYSKLKTDWDATPFNDDFSLDSLRSELKSLGYNEFSDHVMMNGQTGEVMQSLIFMGICCYQRLKHMVINKVHARSRGGRNRLTRQPKEGRGAGGGLRTGTMEKDILLTHGAHYMVKDRLMEQSDPAAFWYCKKCGLQALSIYDPLKETTTVECRLCSTRDVALIKLPYATKLFTQELMGMNIVPRILTTPYNKPK